MRVWWFRVAGPGFMGSLTAKVLKRACYTATRLHKLSYAALRNSRRPATQESQQDHRAYAIYRDCANTVLAILAVVTKAKVCSVVEARLLVDWRGTKSK